MRTLINRLTRKEIKHCHAIWCCWLFFVAVPLFGQKNGCGTVVSNQILAQLAKNRPAIERHVQQFFSRTVSVPKQPLLLPIQAYVVNRNNNSGGISPAELQEAIHTLNANFAGLNVQFSICAPPISISSTDLFEYHSSLESELISAHYIPNTINVYFVHSIDDGIFPGYSYLPGGPDIIIITNNQANKPAFSHEMGHFFGLLDTHSEESCPISDELVRNHSKGHLCEALPASNLIDAYCKRSFVGVNSKDSITYKDTKRSLHALDQQNMMSCSSSGSNKQFTPVQFALMDYYLNHVRNYFLACNGLKTCVLPIVSTKDTGYTYFSLVWNYQGNDTPFHFRYRQEGSANWTTVSDYTSNAITITELTPCTNYEYQIQRICLDAKDSTAWTSVELIKTGGCTDLYLPSYGQSSTEWIDRVQVGGINNTSNNNHGYSNFEKSLTNIKTDVATKIKLTPGTSDQITRNLVWNIWVDLNRDHDFLDPGEMVLQLVGKDNQAVSGNLIIPDKISSGTTRMRIAMNRGGINSPNSVTGFREVEDYSLNIIASKPLPKGNPSVLANQKSGNNWANPFYRNLTWPYFVANMVCSKVKTSLHSEFPTGNLELFDLQGRIDYNARLSIDNTQIPEFDLSGQPIRHQFSNDPIK